VHEPKLDPIERRRLQEANRQPNKVRTEHEGRQGVKAPKLSDLKGREITPDDVPKLQEAFETESDRGAALLYAAFAENALEWAIYRRMPGQGEVIRKKTFSGEKAPLSTFSAKITMGRAMGIYGEQTERLLNGVRDIRNQFAHKLLPIDFKTPEIEAACNALKIPKGLTLLPQRDTPRGKFKLASNWLYCTLMENAFRQTATFSIDLP
jgi:hypothetical protein